MSNKADRGVLFFGIAWIRTLCGVFIATTSVSIPVLAHNVNSSLGTTSWMFTCRIFGAFIGGVTGSWISKKVNPNLVFSLTTFVASFALYWLPVVESLGVLFLSGLVLGIAHGMIDAIGQIIILEHAQNPGRYILGFHTLFTFGSILGSILVRVFLDPGLEQPCPDESERVLEILPDVINNFQYAFIIPSIALFGGAICQLLQVVFKTFDRVNVPKTSMSNPHLHEPRRPSTKFLIYFILTLFFTASCFQLTFSFLHQFTRCDRKLGISSETSALNVVWYWMANMFGRAAPMFFLHKKVNLRLLLTLISIALLLIQLTLEYGNLSAYAFMAFEDIAGFLLSGVIPLYIVYASTIFDLADGYMWTLYVGCHLLCMFMPVGIGMWMTIDIRGYVHASVIACAFILLFQQLMFHATRALTKADSNLHLSSISSAMSIKI